MNMEFESAVSVRVIIIRNGIGSFKAYTKQLVFHFSPMALGKLWIQNFSI